MRKLSRAAALLQLVLQVTWGLSLLALYPAALVPAFSVEVPSWTGSVLLTWPLLLLVSVQAARTELLSSLPLLSGRQFGVWGQLTVPRDWTAESGALLVFRDADRALCRAVVFWWELQQSVSLSLPDRTPLSIILARDITENDAAPIGTATEGEAEPFFNAFSDSSISAALANRFFGS